MRKADYQQYYQDSIDLGKYYSDKRRDQSLKWKLETFMDNMKTQDTFKEFWGDNSWNQKAPSNNYAIHVDTDKDVIAIKSQDKDVKGRPMYEYEINKNKGTAKETMRLKNGTETRSTLKNFS